MKQFFRPLICVLVLFIGGCASAPAKVQPVVVTPIPGTDTIAIPLTEMGGRTYKSLKGGLYPDRSNTEPADHDAVGTAHRNAIRPLDVNGQPSGSGRYVLISIGGPGVSAAWCSLSSAPPCSSWSFAGRAVSDRSVNHGALVIVNGASANGTVAAWSSPLAANYDRIRDTRLAPLGLSENQVQAIWMSVFDGSVPFPAVASSADASTQLNHLGATIRSLKQRYPNLQLLFLTSGRYSGYSPNGEPLAYESGFVARWMIESQISQMRSQSINPDAGDLTPSGRIAPWISWGPYVWTIGGQPKSDGLSWPRSDYDSSATRFSPSGEAKIGGVVLEFFKTSPYTRCWFLAGPVCG